ncbi:DUF262 domain-containing protein [Bosea caraganae]|uniref:DUF262 domain-containing protein n=1 Tax=Bosea caraganae TaxID=2763117 RepID=A0A370L0Q8_9HYPH|nr:DUF262 domain-containing protein [Bosea caraganae]RDJ20686.1 DUF262 domain-containing protein [Bosea caraganae]RDJ28963.1 DUF262 domain-containing protein [Bosea caraganae]
MAAQFDFQPTTLLNILKDRYLAVPRYQRSYSWTDEEITDYWSDINKAIAEGRDYFMGTIVLSSEEGGVSQSIIDGQQRVSTTTILLASIRDQFKAGGVDDAANGLQNQFIAPYDVNEFAPKPRIRLNTSDNNFYENLIVKGDHPPPTLDSHKLILAAKVRFDTEIKYIVEVNPSHWKKKLADIVAFLTDKARVVAVRAPTDADAFTIFETLNDRGADLTIADLLKNYLFSSSGSEIDFVQERWIESISILGLYQPNREFVNFMRHLWSSKSGATRERDLYRRIKDRVRTKQDAVEFSKEIADGAKLYGAILTTDNEFWKDFLSEAMRSVEQLQSLDLEQNRPLLLAVFAYFSKDETAKCISSLVSWSVRGIVAGVLGGGQAERYYCEAAVDIREGKIKDTPALLAKLTPLVPSDTAFREAFGRFGTASGKLARYMLLAVERHMQGDAEPELVPNEDYDSVNLEHILPKNAKVIDWPLFSPEEVNVFAHRIGNMTLLRKTENAKIGNKAWAVKRPIIAASSLKINKTVSSNTEWRRNEIDVRQTELANIALTVWSLS